jgi:hypothetical protein
VSTPTPLAAVVLAHADAPHVRRLVRALDDVPVFLHCDAKTPHEVFREMLAGSPDRVTVVPRRPTSLASWSLVDAELAGLRAALARTDARHIAVLSGADYPVVPMRVLFEELAAAPDRTLMWNVPLPLPAWDTPRHPDGGMWRLRYRFLTWRDQVVFLRDVPLRWPRPRRLPEGVEFRAGSQWKVYARRDAEALVRTAETRPDLVRFWRTTLVPDETFAASVLATPELTGAAALAPCTTSRWFMDWPGKGAQHPRWLTEAHFDRLAAPRAPSVPAGGGSSLDEAPGRTLFARKFSSREPRLLDRIDDHLRS